MNAPSSASLRFPFLECFPADEAARFSGIWERVSRVLCQPPSQDGIVEIVESLGAWVEEMSDSDRAVFTDIDGVRVPFGRLSEDLRALMVSQLMHEVPREQAEATHLTELMYQICPTFDRAEWPQSRVLRTDERLLIRGYQVMDAWETPIMHAMVDTSLRECAADRPRVLEIGWGMGISGQRYLEAGVDYTVIEAHPEVAADARRRSAPFAGTVIEGFWEDIKFPESSFDIIFFDAYHTTHDPHRSYLEDSTRHFFPMLSRGGVFETFANDVLERIECMLECGFERVVCHRIDGFHVPQDCTYFPTNATDYVDTTGIK